MHRAKLLAAVTSALFLLVVSAVLGYSELYIMSAALISVPLISYVVGMIGVSRLQCTRDAIGFANEGAPFQVRLNIVQKSSLLGPIEIEDQLPEWIVRTDTTAPGEGATRRAGDGAKAEDDSAVSYTAIARKRGEYALGPVRLHVSDPLGFFHFRRRYRLFSKLIILPSALMIPELAIRPMGRLGEYQFDGYGAKGSGIDFHGVREYNRGDELRRVHWRSTAKHNRLNVIEYEHSRAEDAVIAIDLRRGSEVGSGIYTSLEYGVRIAAGIIEQTLDSGSSARIIGDGIVGPAAMFGRGLDHLHVLLDALARVRADRPGSMSDMLFRELTGIGDNTTVICLAAAIDEGLVPCAELLAARGVKLQFIQINVLDEAPEDQLAGAIMRTGASLAVVDCSTNEVEGHVRYGHAV